MSDTGFLFRASWPILDDSYTLSRLRVEACAVVDELARQAGARIVGDLRWAVVDARLYAEGPAVPLVATVIDDKHRVRYGSVTGRAEQIRMLAAAGWTDARMAAAFGCTSSAVAKVRQRHGIRPGVGEQQRRKGQAA